MYPQNSNEFLFAYATNYTWIRKLDIREAY